MRKSQSAIQEDSRFRVLRLLNDNPAITQRELADRLGISLGATNYLLQSLLKNELAFNRKLNVERLKLQNELMRRDLAAIDVVNTRSQDSALDARAIEHDQVPSHQPSKARRKSR